MKKIDEKGRKTAFKQPYRTLLNSFQMRKWLSTGRQGPAPTPGSVPLMYCITGPSFHSNGLSYVLGFYHGLYIACMRPINKTDAG